jgi:hypothetical protein
MGPVEVNERPQPAVLACSGEFGHRFGISAAGVERNKRLVGIPVAHQLQRPEDAQTTHFADARVPLGEGAQLRADDVGPQRASVLLAPMASTASSQPTSGLKLPRRMGAPLGPVKTNAAGSGETK